MKQSSLSTLHRSAHHSGFSLVEVTMALGIVAFAFVALLGLIPTGLSVFKAAVDTSVGMQIVQKISNDLQQTEYSSLQSTLRYFDEQGNEVEALSSSRIYDVSVLVNPTTPLPETATPNLATVSVRIANNPGRNPDIFTTSSPIPYSAFSLLVARN